MGPAVSVVVTSAAGDELDDLVASLDVQTLPWSAFELVVDQGEGPSSPRLSQLAGRRPNVRVVGADSGLGSWSHTATGEYVLFVQSDDVLFPEALERLTGYAIQHGLDLLLARVASPGTVPDQLLVQDRVAVDAAEVEGLVRGAALLVRREAAGPDGSAEPRAGMAVGILSSYPALRRPPADPTSPPSAVGLRSEAGEARWSGSVLELSLGVVVEVEAEDGPGGVEPSWSALVREESTQLSFVLPCRARARSPLGWDVDLRLEVATAAAGAPLTPGVWAVELGARAGSLVWGPTPVRVELPPAAVLDGLLVAPIPSEDSELRLDVGLTRTSLASRLTPDDLTVVESAGGSLATLRLPDVVVTGSSRTPGLVAVGSLRLPAVLHADGDGVRAEAYLSGLPGSSRLATQFGSGPLAPTGLDLVIDGSGVMSAALAAPPKPKAVPAPSPAPAPIVAPAPVLEPKPQAKPKAAPKKPVPPPAPLTRVQHLRRALPAATAPVADAVARWPFARRLYRRAAGLNRR